MSEVMELDSCRAKIQYTHALWINQVSFQGHGQSFQIKCSILSDRLLYPSTVSNNLLMSGIINLYLFTIAVDTILYIYVLINSIGFMKSNSFKTRSLLKNIKWERGYNSLC